MGTLTRKQREIADREHLILRVARGMLLERGYLGLSMDRIAEATEYSKGTIYQHFASKEDLVGALLLESQRQRANMFTRATTFQGRPRERLAAVGVADDIFVRLYPDHFRIEQIASVESINDKITTDRLAALEELHGMMMEKIRAVLDDAVAAGDLELPEGVAPCQILFGLWSMAIGAHTIETSERECQHLEVSEPGAALWANYQLLLDAYGWKPLSTEWDYLVTVERIRREVFADECRRLEA